MRPVLTAALLGIAAFGAATARSLTSDAPGAPEALPLPPSPDSAALVEAVAHSEVVDAAEPAVPRPTVAPLDLAKDCDGGSALVIAQELSRSVLEGREVAPAQLTSALEDVRASLPRRVDVGIVGFAQRLLTPAGTATADPDTTPWVPLGSPDAIPEPPSGDDPLGTCANVALGLHMAIAQLETSPATARALWLVVDGLHDCDVDGQFAYAALDPIVDRAAAASIDVSVLVVDGWTTRRGPTPLTNLVRGHGTVARTPAWELEDGFATLARNLRTVGCP